MKGTFKKKEHLDGFVNPLKNFAAIIGDGGIVINFEKKDDKVVASIDSINQSVGTVIKSSYKEIFDDFSMDGDSCKIGILKVAEFVSLFGLVDDDPVEIEFNETSKDLAITQGKSKIIYQTSDPDLIKEFKKPFGGSNWYASFAYDDKFSKFTRAMSVLSNEECIIMEGDDVNGKVYVTVRNKGVAINSYKVELDIPVSQGFDLAYKKETMQAILSPKHDSTKITVGERVVMVECKDKYNDAVYYVAKMTK